MEITEVRLTLRHEERLKAFVSITFDNAFVVRGLKVIDGNTGFLPSTSVSSPLARTHLKRLSTSWCTPMNSVTSEVVAFCD